MKLHENPSNLHRTRFSWKEDLERGKGKRGWIHEGEGSGKDKLTGFVAFFLVSGPGSQLLLPAMAIWVSSSREKLFCGEEDVPGAVGKK